MNTRALLLILLGIGFALSLPAQKNAERLARIDKRLNILIEEGTQLGKPVTISLTGPIQELVSFLAESTGTSITVAPDIRRQVSVTFNKVPVNDILLYLCDNFELELQPTGDIIHLQTYVPPPIRPDVKEPEVGYDARSGLIRMNLRADTLSEILRKVSQVSGQSVSADPLVKNRRITTYINNLPLEAALEQLARSSELRVNFSNGYYLLEDDSDNDPFGAATSTNSSVPAANANSNNPSNTSRNSNSTTTDNGSLRMRRSGDDRINIQAENVSILEIVEEVAKELKHDYYILSDLPATTSTSAARNPRNREQSGQIGGVSASLSEQFVTLQVTDKNFAELLTDLFRNTGYTFEYQRQTYVIGPRISEGIRISRVFKFQYRSARGVADYVPEIMQSGVVIDTLYELNSLVLTGSEDNIEEITHFLHKLDKVVPVVNIELTIIDVQSSKLEEYGIEAGIVSGGREAGGRIISGDDAQNGTDFTFSPDAVNRVLDLLTGQGLINLGRVSPNFYLSLSALQADGIIDIKSTPKLSTLNSHPAILSIGEKRYFQEQQVNFPGFDRPIPVQSAIFREIEANLLVEINPIVSGDEQVTLEIAFEQSEFLENTGPNAPPPSVSRRFESMIRARNGETVVLGGLERELRSNTRNGLPWLSRIPVIGWLFGKQRKAKQKNKLLIFLKPTIING
ncbi:MAG: secretin N-terminal domain-containing protein [Bacteroidota bacterium]